MKILWVIVLLVAASIEAFGNAHQVRSLNGDWSFLVDREAGGDSAGWGSGLPGQAHKVTVPHTWNTDPASETYLGIGWYQKSFTVPSEWKGKAVYLKFGAVYHDAWVYINGRRVGDHCNSGYTPFSFDISSFLAYGSGNSLVVRVDNSYSETALPYRNSFDWACDGGITRDVTLHISDRPSIKYIHVTPEMHPSDSTGKASVAVRFWERDIASVAFNVVCREKKSGRVVWKGIKKADRTGETFDFSLDCGTITPWHFDRPFMYTLEVTVAAKGRITDSQAVSFGFKKVELKGEKFFFNGESVRLPGLEYMPMSHPAYGAAEPIAIADSVVRMMKDLNVVITRFHWQQDEAFLDLMDEHGILVQEELPWWQQPATLNPQLRATAEQQMTEMIEAHYNHPSIFAWGISNEVSNTNSEEYRRLKAFMRLQDSTRMINVVGNWIHHNLRNDISLVGDLPTWNEYMGTWHGKNREELPGMLDKVQPILDGRPLLITENGLCEPHFSGGDARRVDDMLFHMKEWCSRPFIVGYIYFCLNDYRTHVGEEGIGRFKIRRHGLTDVYLRPKPSYYLFKQLCTPVEISALGKSNESDAKVTIRAKASIPQYTLVGYTLEYRTIDGTSVRMPLPVLTPGSSIELVLKNVNPNYAFEVQRPDGSVVAGY
jgi:beta-galactosidase